MFRIKICGITNKVDALSAVGAGADAIGLNFYEKSPRSVTAEQAKQVCKAVERRAECFGVFVNASRDAIQSVLTEADLNGVQLHGDETPATVAEMARLLRPPLDYYEEEMVQDLLDQAEGESDESLRSAALQSAQLVRDRLEADKMPPVVRARRMTDEGVAAIAADLEACEKAGGKPGAVLVDAFTPGRYGGTGETVSWAGLSDYKKWLGDVPLILAGGLNPDNVAEAIRIVRPHGVDVASGVESSPGVKDHGKVRAFVAAANSVI